MENGEHWLRTLDVLNVISHVVRVCIGTLKGKEVWFDVEDILN